MKGYRRVQENKAYKLYVLAAKNQRVKVSTRPALLGDYNINIETYYFTDKENPSDEEKGDCIYVEKRFITRRKNKVLKSTMIVRNTEWNSTSVAMIWSRWH